MNLDGKVAFVTGGSSGIGRASAAKLAADGADVAILAREREELHEAEDAIEEASGKEALPIVADISKYEDMQRATQQVVDELGRLDILLANAGINGTWAPIDELDMDEWKQTIDINLTGTFITIKTAVPHLREGGGSIIVTASINGTRTFSLSGATAYATSKGGQVAMAKMLALELAPEGIRVNAICPGQVATDIEERTEREELEGVRYPRDFPEGKVPLMKGEPGKPEQVAEVVAFLASDESDLVTGTPVWVDGGQSLLMG